MDIINKALGCAFFISAGVLLAVTKTPDIFTVAAVAACAVVAALAITRHTSWSVFGAALLMGVSLTLQTALSYRCMDCVKADLLILAGMIYLSIIDNSLKKNVFRGMAVVIASMFLVNAWLHYPVFSGTPPAAAASEVGQYITVLKEGKSVSLDTSVKPVLMFSPSCGACRSTIERLAKIDTEGKTWVPVQVDGEFGEGSALLDSVGYRGNAYQSGAEWNEAVPAFIFSQEGKTKVLYGEGIIKAFGGDQG